MERYTDLAKHVRRMLFENQGDWRFSGSGTCFLLRHQARDYVATAKHVLRGYSPGQIRVMAHPELPCDDVTCLTLKQPFTFAHHGDRDFEDFVVAPIEDHDAGEANQGLFFPYQPVSDCHFTVSATSRLVAVGFADENQDIDYDRSQISSQGTIVMASAVAGRDADLMYELTLGSDCGLSSFSRFSGSPVFSHAADGVVRVVGIVLRGSASCRVLRFLDIRAVIEGIEYHTLLGDVLGVCSSSQ